MGDRPKTVLVVDDNESIRRVVADQLGRSGLNVVEASDGVQGLEAGLTSNPDVIVLDVVMPGIDGFKLCHIFREKGLNVPIIMLTERSTIEDKVAGFSMGADDYLPKPFSALELELRIQALLRRSESDLEKPKDRFIRRGDLEIDLDQHVARIAGKELPLTPIEFNLLKILASSPGRVFTRQDLLFLIWDTDYAGYKRNIDPHITRLRTKMEANPRKPKYILTVWGIGYKFNDSLNGQQ